MERDNAYTTMRCNNVLNLLQPSVRLRVILPVLQPCLVSFLSLVLVVPKAMNIPFIDVVIYQCCIATVKYVHVYFYWLHLFYVWLAVLCSGTLLKVQFSRGKHL